MPKVDFKSQVLINDQNIEVHTQVTSDMCVVNYGLRSSEAIVPETVAVALYLMSRDICERLNINIDGLVEDLLESDSELH